jgi:hypothetical protein
MVGIIGILFFSMSKKDGKQEITEAAPTQKASAKPSKKKKKSKSKTSKRADASSAASEGDFKVGKVGETALAEPEISEPEIVEEEIVSEPEAIVAPVETSVKRKKSKETPEQKASRLERQKLAKAAAEDIIQGQKLAKAAAEDIIQRQKLAKTAAEDIIQCQKIAKVAAEDIIQPVPESDSISAATSSSDSVSTHFDGWAVVEKSKSKKGAAGNTTEPTTEEGPPTSRVNVSHFKPFPLQVDYRKLSGVRAYNEEITRLRKQQKFREVVELFNETDSRGIKPDVVTCNQLITVYGKQRRP